MMDKITQLPMLAYFAVTGFFRDLKKDERGLSGVVVAVLTNVFLIFPAYMALYGMDWAAIVQMCTAVNPWITSVPTMVAFSIVPFNVISFSVTSILAMLLYKKISVPLKKFALIG